MVRGLKESLKASDARVVLSLIKKGLNCPEEDLPRGKNNQSSEANVDITVDLMNAIVRLRAKKIKSRLRL